LEKWTLVLLTNCNGCDPITSGLRVIVIDYPNTVVEGETVYLIYYMYFYLVLFEDIIYVIVALMDFACLGTVI
jgi:hypothetical protein